MYEFTPEMSEISGFGGSYELACRAMLKAGLEWWDKNPKANPKFEGYKGVYGAISESNKDAEMLTKAMMDARLPDGTRCGDEATGAMVEAVVHHIFYVRKHGWDEYKKAMKKGAKNEN